MTTDIAPPVDPDAAERFVRQHCAETGGDPTARLEQIAQQIDWEGTYDHTSAELAWACKVAWRNTSTCIGRAGWAALVVRDRRHVTGAAQMAAETIAHVRDSTGTGRIRPTMTVFAPARPGQVGPRMWNPQVIRYAGDPGQAPVLDYVRSRGWRWDGDPWALLPLVIDDQHGGDPQLFDVPRDAVLELRLDHPDYQWFGDLGLRWHALPAITDMRLEAGGLWYSSAPFGGWYVEVEVAARNLADPDRLNMLPQIADLLGLDRSSRWVDWRDRATLVLNEAVLFSFQRAGVSISAKRQEAGRLLAHLERERLAGRPELAAWSWVNLPSAAPLPTYHRYYDPRQLSPALVRNLQPTALRCPVTTTSDDSFGTPGGWSTTGTASSATSTPSYSPAAGPTSSRCSRAT